MSALLFGSLLMSLVPHLAPKPLCVGPVQPRLYMTVGISGDNALGAFLLTSPASLYYSDCWASSVPTSITGEHAILSLDGIDHRKAVESINTSSGSWSGWLSTAAVPTWCYFGDLEAQQFDVGQQEVASSLECAPAGQCTLTVNVNGTGQVSGANIGLNVLDCFPSARLTAHPADGWAFEQWSGAVQTTEPSVTVGLSGDKYMTATFVPLPPPDGSGGGTGDIDPGGGGYNEDPPCFYGDPTCPYSPIIINFAPGSYALTGRNSPVLFDMCGDRHPVLIGWTAAEADEAFLWLDRNYNGRVTSGAELFGNFTPLKSGLLAKNGFEALAEFDSNHDGVVDDSDPVWSRLQLWRDLNHNGIAEAGEVSSIDDSDVVAISLNYHWTGRHDTWGNGFRYASSVSLRNRNGHGVRKKPVYDIFFVPVSN